MNPSWDLCNRAEPTATVDISFPPSMTFLILAQRMRDTTSESFSS